MCDINEDFIRCVKANDLELVKDALKCGANVHFNNDDALLSSVCDEHLEMMTLLLDNGADMYARNGMLAIQVKNGIRERRYGLTSSPWTWAIYHGRINAVKMFLEHSSSIRKKNVFELRLGALKGHDEIVTMLLKNGVDIHYDDDAALQYGISGGHIKIVTTLLKAGANVNVQHGVPLRSSVAKGELAIVAKLLKYGANIHCHDDAILKHLKKNFNEKLASVLLSYCADEDYHYFPDAYIKTKIVATKSAANA